jgi:hypothetical protein
MELSEIIRDRAMASFGINLYHVLVEKISFSATVLRLLPRFFHKSEHH